MNSLMKIPAQDREEGSDMIANNITGEGNVAQPPSKRQCTRESSDPSFTTDGVSKIGDDMPNIDLPLPIPQQVGQVNVRQDGSVNHDYGVGHHQVNITHCDRIDNQVIGLGVPTMFLNPEIGRNTNEVNDFNQQVVSIC